MSTRLIIPITAKDFYEMTAPQRAEMIAYQLKKKGVALSTTTVDLKESSKTYYTFSSNKKNYSVYLIPQRFYASTT